MSVLGYGFLEIVYQRAMPIALAKRGLHCETEVDFDVEYDASVVGSTEPTW